MQVNPSDVKIEASWKAALQSEFEQPYFAAIKQFLVTEKKAGKNIYPPGKLIFNAFELTPFDEVKVVVIGQDPYHRKGQAMGLSFSVPEGVRTPPSLKRIYKEIVEDIPGFQAPNHGDLTAWAKQGVLLLNAFLTVEEGKAGSHQKIGWHKFTDAVIQKISAEKEGIVFLLWGGFAKKKAALIDGSKHHVLSAAHPSPLAGNAFFGNKHFSQTNKILEERGLSPIDWNL